MCQKGEENRGRKRKKENKKKRREGKEKREEAEVDEQRIALGNGTRVQDCSIVHKYI